MISTLQALLGTQGLKNPKSDNMLQGWTIASVTLVLISCLWYLITGPEAPVILRRQHERLPRVYIDTLLGQVLVIHCVQRPLRWKHPLYPFNAPIYRRKTSV